MNRSLSVFCGPGLFRSFNFPVFCGPVLVQSQSFAGPRTGLPNTIFKEGLPNRTLASVGEQIPLFDTDLPPTKCPAMDPTDPTPVPVTGHLDHPERVPQPPIPGNAVIPSNAMMPQHIPDEPR